MSETEARIGYGQTLEIALASAPSVFTYIPEVFDSNPPGESDENVQATHHQSPNKTHEYVPGMVEPGSASYEMNYVPGSAADVFLRATIRGKKLIARHTFANGVQILYNCSRESYETPSPNDDRKTASLSLKVSGTPLLSAAAAPRNLVAPSISGEEEVGQVLTAQTGDWAGALDFTFQWQADTSGNGTFANISGATGQTFVLTSSQEGDDVRCVVTASNESAFTTAANSAETGAIAAAS